MSKVEMTDMQASTDGVAFSASAAGTQGLFLVPVDILSDLACSSMDFEDEMLETFAANSGAIEKATWAALADGQAAEAGERVVLSRAGFPGLD